MDISQQLKLSDERRNAAYQKYILSQFSLQTSVAKNNDQLFELQLKDLIKKAIKSAEKYKSPADNPDWRKLFALAADAFHTAIKEVKPRFIELLAKYNVNGWNLISIYEAQNALDKLKKEKCFDYIWKNDPRKNLEKDCAELKDRLQSYLNQFKKQKIAFDKGAAPTQYVGMPSPVETVRSNVMFGYGSAQICYADETLVLPTEKDVNDRLALAYLVGGEEGLVVKDATFPGAGFGLFLSETAPKSIAIGTLVTKYAGTIISAAEANELFRHGHGSHIRSLRAGGAFAIHGITSRLEIGGKGGGSMANDIVDFSACLLSDEYGKIIRRKTASYNCKYAIMTNQANADASVAQFKPEQAHIVLVAIQTIRPGDELFVDYGDVFWHTRLGNPV